MYLVRDMDQQPRGRVVSVWQLVFCTRGPPCNGRQGRSAYALARVLLTSRLNAERLFCKIISSLHLISNLQVILLLSVIRICSLVFCSDRPSNTPMVNQYKIVFISRTYQLS